jgi:hypothetical protein
LGVSAGVSLPWFGYRVSARSEACGCGFLNSPWNEFTVLVVLHARLPSGFPQLLVFDVLNHS